MTKPPKFKRLTQAQLLGEEFLCSSVGLLVPGSLTLTWLEVEVEDDYVEETLKVMYRRPGARRRKSLGYTGDSLDLQGIEGDVIGLLRFLNNQQDRAEELF